jgi:hypothetical protein
LATSIRVLHHHIDAYRGRLGVEPICRVLAEHGVPIAPSSYRAARDVRPSRGRCETRCWPRSSRRRSRPGEGPRGLRRPQDVAQLPSERAAGRNKGRAVGKLQRIIGINHWDHVMVPYGRFEFDERTVSVRISDAVDAREDLAHCEEEQIYIEFEGRVAPTE